MQLDGLVQGELSVRDHPCHSKIFARTNSTEKEASGLGGDFWEVKMSGSLIDLWKRALSENEAWIWIFDIIHSIMCQIYREKTHQGHERRSQSDLLITSVSAKICP